jgi:hypothetical protein
LRLGGSQRRDGNGQQRNQCNPAEVDHVTDLQSA